jgi:Fe(3+) dicitrate transport protein
MLWLFEFDLKKSGSFDFVFFKEGYSIVEQNNITTGSTLTIALTKIINLSEVIMETKC